MRRRFGWIAAAGLVVALFPAATNAAVLTWNFGTGSPGLAQPSSAPVTDVATSNFTIGNPNGTVAAELSTTSPSTGSFSGLYNLGNAMRIGALVTGAGGSGYFTVTFTPASGKAIEISDLDFGARSTGTGSQAFSIRTSIDNYAAEVAGSTVPNSSTWTSVPFTFSSPITGAIDTPVEVRIYGYNGAGTATANTVNTRIDDVSISIAAVPEPGSVAVGGLLAGAGLLSRRRQRTA